MSALLCTCSAAQGRAKAKMDKPVPDHYTFAEQHSTALDEPVRLLLTGDEPYHRFSLYY